ncbi:MAG: right-handed parallel beta-helix repeat-containing protein, partial [Pirellulaceae bacterium]|nr:right-handed parallel beta-helix repeat-containing protein [Pirellulaceae bacterium]
MRRDSRRPVVLLTVIASAIVLSARVGTADAVYHVAGQDVRASDENTGSGDRPFKTIMRACQVVEPGDTIVVHQGIYRERVVLKRSGAPDRPITLRGAVDQQAVIDGEGVDVPKQYGLLELDRVAHVIVENLEIRNTTQDGIRALEPDYLTIRQVNVHHCGRSGMMLTHQPKRSDSRVIECDVHDNQLAGIAIWENSGGYFTLRGNRVHGNLGVSNWDGIEIIDTPYVAVLGNTVYDNAPEQGRPEGDQIDAGGTNSLTSPSHHVIYEGNLVYGRGGGVKMNNEPLHCIIRRNVILDTALVFYEGPTKIAICQNTVVNGPHALQFWGDGRSADFGGTQVRNNLFVDSTSYTVNIGNKAVPTTESISMDYNLYRFREDNFRGINVNAASFDATFPPTDAGLAQFRERTGQEQNGRVVTQTREEMFADPDSRDFRLKSGSAAIDAGGPLTFVVSQPDPKLLRLGNAWFFQDGWNGLLEPDAIRVGDETVQVEAIDYERHEIRVERQLRAEPGMSVSLPYSGQTPDAGA